MAAQISYISQIGDYSAESSDVPLQDITTRQKGDPLFQLASTNASPIIRAEPASKDKDFMSP
jgi:hypothetical protein